MRRKYRRGGPPRAGRRLSGKAVLISATVGVLAAGTGISLAATQRGGSPSVTCIVVADAAAAADAGSALSDVFPVGTALHLTSGGRAVDVTVSGPITAAAATTPPAATSAPAATASASATATASASASGSGGAGTGGKRHHHRKPARTPGKGAATGGKAATATPSATGSTDPAASVPRVAVKAAANNGVDANSVCVKLSTNAFNTLGNAGNGNNVGAFIATMTPAAAAGSPAATTSSTATGGRKHRNGRS